MSARHTIRKDPKYGSNQPYVKSHLTPRCLQVLSMLAYGLTDKEIAPALRISEKTVQFFRLKVKRTLNLQSESELARVGIAFNLTPL